MSSMTLNIHVEGDPEALRQTARWLTRTAKETDEAARQVHLARLDSQDGWEGEAAEGFRSVMDRARGDVGDVVRDLERTSTALTAFADELDGCKQGMRRAREHAAKASLRTTDTTIDPPAGPPPVMPKGLGMGPYVGWRARAYNDYVAARDQYAAEVKAYYEAAVITNACRRKERQAQKVLLGYLSSFNQSSPFDAANITAGVAGATMTRTSRFLAVAERWETRAERAMDLARNPNLADRPWTRRMLRTAAANADLEARMQEQRAFNTKLAQALHNSKLADTLLNPNGSTRVLREVPGLKRVAPVTKGIPLIGWAITGASITTSIGQGKDPVTATASGVGGTLAGSAAGGAATGSVGGPFGTAVGLVVGTVVGVGVGFSIERWGDDVVGWLDNKATEVAKDINEPQGLG